MTDYASMTDAELNRAIAEALGYKIELTRAGYYRLVINGDKQETRISEADARRDIPSWATDLNAAAALDFGEWTLTATYYPDKTVEISAYDFQNDGYPQFKIRDTEARACTIAWLMYMDAIEAKG